MQNVHNGVRQGCDRYDHIEGLLARYPHLTDVEVADLKTWFVKEASAFEVASLASKESLHIGYMAFRAEHIDRLKTVDYLVAAGVLVTIAAVILYFIV